VIKLEYSEILQRKIRKDDIPNMGISTWEFIRDFVQSGESKKALDLMDYEVTRNRVIHDLLIQFIQEMLTEIAKSSEDQVPKFWRKISEPLMKMVLSRKLNVEEILQLDAELQRCHFGEIRVAEEPDRYVMTCDPCGAGCRLRRERALQTARNAYTQHAWPWSENLGVTKKPYPWSWGKAGVPYYCIHCSIMWEIIPTELIGYPIRLHNLGDKPEDPCVHIYYKEPESIPEGFFTRIGMTKKTAKGTTK
jgi:hypothetical protein